MPFYKFKSNDVFYNRVKVNPKQSFLIHNQKVYLNNEYPTSGALNGSTLLRHVPAGHASLYEMNIDRPSGQLINPFITKGSAREGFGSTATSSFASLNFGADVTGSYAMSASISKFIYYSSAGSTGRRQQIKALRNTLNFYTPLSPHYQYDSSLGSVETADVGLVTIPSIFYGSSIKKGSVSLKFFISGTMAAELVDKNKNGELIQVSGTAGRARANNENVAGVVLYNEGFVVLTGSWALSAHSEDYGAGATTPKWYHFAQSISGSVQAASSSFELSFEGEDYVSTMTMMAHAPAGELNHSNNPTYTQFDASRVYFSSGSTGYSEPEDATIKNIVSSSFVNATASFQKHTYISQIGIYDEDKNLIAIAKTATPIKKTEERDYTFKLKLDI